MRESVVGRALIYLRCSSEPYIYIPCVAGFGSGWLGWQSRSRYVTLLCWKCQSNYIESVRDRVADRLIGVCSLAIDMDDMMVRLRGV